MRTDQAPDRDFRTRRFGRGKGYSAAAMPSPSTAASDLRLFALTFAGGFLFMTVYLV